MKSAIQSTIEKMLMTPKQRTSNYQKRLVGRVDPEGNNGISVSTCWTDDEGWETALLDNNGAWPVERYSSNEEAVIGHKKWVEFAKSGDSKTIVILGSTTIPNTEAKIVLEKVVA